MSFPITSATQSTQLRTLSDLTSTAYALDKDAFMQLLVAQLSYQDPLEPASDTEFISQLTQFAMLEQMEQINGITSTNQAYGLMGKYVYVDTTGEGIEYAFGQVDGVTIRDGQTYLIVGDQEYAYENVTAAINSIESNLDQVLVRSADLIGRTITAQISEEGEEPVSVSGVVSHIIVKDGAVCAVVDGTEVPIDAIEQIQS